MKESKKFRGFLEIIFILIILVISAYIIDANIEFFNSLIGNNLFGIIFYILLEILAIVVAPVTTLPLIVLASSIFGWVNAAIYSIIGWVIGSIIAFEIARKYGKGIVEKLVPLEKFERFGEKVSEENSYLGLIFLRIIFPSDLLSYFLGLFSKIKFKKYLITTIIGITPLAFGFAYIGDAPFKEQIIYIFSLALIMAIVWIVSLSYKTLIPEVSPKLKKK